MENSLIEMQLNSLNHSPWNDKDKETIKALIQQEHNVINSRNEKGETLLHQAVKQNACEIVELLLEHGATVDCRCNKNQTPLHTAVELRKHKIINILLENDANININCSKKKTPLVYAIIMQNLEVVNLLLKYNPNLNFSSNGSSPLHYAVKRNSIDITKQLLEHGADVNFVEELSEFTPLHQAAIKGNMNMMKLLVSHGANVNARNIQGHTPFFSLVVYMILSCPEKQCWLEFKQLMSFAVKGGVNINTVDVDNNTPLHEAIKEGSVKMAEILLKHGALVDVLNDEQLSPLSIAVLLHHKKLVALLLNNNANINFAVVYYSPLHVVAMSGNMQILNMLLKRQPNVDTLMYQGVTPLITAIDAGKINIVKRLLDYGADINLRTVDDDNVEISPLINAIVEDQSEMVYLLLERGADVNLECGGCSPLHISMVSKKCVDSFYLLLNYNPNINADSPYGTPLHFAMSKDVDDEIIMELLELGADINIKETTKNMTVLQQAIDKKKKIVIDTLLMKIMQLKVLGTFVIPELLEDFHNEMKSRGTSYEVELQKLKSKIIHPKYKLSLYDVCTQTVDELSVFLRNKEIRNNLKVNNYNNCLTTFSSYARRLKCYIDEVIQEVEMSEESHKVVRRILWNVDQRRILPNEVTMQITNFFAEEEREILLEVF